MTDTSLIRDEKSYRFSTYVYRVLETGVVPEEINAYYPEKKFPLTLCTFSRYCMTNIDLLNRFFKLVDFEDINIMAYLNQSNSTVLRKNHGKLIDFLENNHISSHVGVIPTLGRIELPGHWYWVKKHRLGVFEELGD